MDVRFESGLEGSHPRPRGGVFLKKTSETPAEKVEFLCKPSTTIIICSQNLSSSHLGRSILNPFVS
jgi:hypothetical protein